MRTGTAESCRGVLPLTMFVLEEGSQGHVGRSPPAGLGAGSVEAVGVAQAGQQPAHQLVELLCSQVSHTQVPQAERGLQGQAHSSSHTATVQRNRVC